MAASSSNHQWIYDVFINFRGNDTRDSFVSHLHAALSNAGIDAFFDDKSLEKGDELKSVLLRAIEGTYGQLVIPIFYHVEPSDVRYQKGPFALEVNSRRRGRRRENLVGWRTALHEIANLSGYDLSTDRSEAEAINNIVKNVFGKLYIRVMSITNFPVGLVSRLQEVIKLIESQPSKVCMVGIWGMGGLGKTTTAKAIFNQIHRQFMCASFIGNIREAYEDRRGPIDLQEQLLSDILETKEKIHSIERGTAMIKKILSGKRALVILDDVTTSEQLKALCGNREWFASGSVIIVTTRDVRLLSSLKADYVYKMNEMNKDESLELFSWHAFGEASPEQDFTELSRSVVAYCGGLPLALEVLGSYLNEREKKEWKSVLSKLDRIPNDQVQQKLRISYDGLKDELEKNIFLDICCFFIGKDRAYVTEILNGCGFYADIGITRLIEMSLLKVERNNKLGMHDLVRDMGREIVRETSTQDPGKRNRLWFHEDAHDVLTKNTGTETVEGLVLKMQRTERGCFNANAFKEMKKLRLLQLDSVDLTGDYQHLSHELRWVHWKGFTSTFIPDHFYLGNLVVLELKYSSIKQVWKETKLLKKLTKLLKKLKVLNLSHSKDLVNTPDFSKLPNLEELILKDCPSLFELHPSIAYLSNLLLINLEGCTSLTNLPGKTYQLKSVKTLILSGCSKIDKLEEDIVQMESLTTLIAKDTAIKEVPHSILRLESIAYISLCGYEGLTRDVFPSLIRSWISPTMNPLSRIPLFPGMSLSQVSMDIQNYRSGILSSWLSSLSKLRSVWIQCHSEIQLTQESRRILDDQYDVNSMDLEASSSYASQISDFSLKSLLIRLGSCHTVIETLASSIPQGSTTNASSNFVLPGGDDPSWLAYKGEGPSVHFQVPEDRDCCLKGIVLCVVYSSTPESMATECLTSVMINNHTKFTIQIYKKDTVMSFNDEDWESVKSNLDPGDNMEIIVSFGRGLTVKGTAVYLIYAQSIIMEIQPSITVEVEFEPSVNGKMEPSSEVNIHPSPNLKMEPSPKPTKTIFTRLVKRIGKCSCLNQN
ncbi:disease resistance protein RUN1-like [Lotus japonicus]|uniref:disease resistance protein RUN1-like n=1 Tax=Lotus japonicus TaxID=34305 RepID=UPI00258B3B2A|nr:disease resistance protein RUN1-like [Lotus japonicus]